MHTKKLQQQNNNTIKKINRQTRPTKKAYFLKTELDLKNMETLFDTDYLALQGQRFAGTVVDATSQAMKLLSCQLMVFD